MNSLRKMRIAFLLNLSFSLIELFGGFWVGSVSILSDALHDFGDSISIGLSLIFEKTAQKQPNATHPYGYRRYSVLGSFLTAGLLCVSSLFVIAQGVRRLIHPILLNQNGILILAVFGLLINGIAALVTHGGRSLNQRSVSLHLLEDVLGWAAVLLGGTVIKLTGWVAIDPLLSIGIALWILLHAVKQLKAVLNVFLEKTPSDIDSTDIQACLESLEAITAIRYLRIRSIDGIHAIASVRVVTDQDALLTKTAVRSVLSAHGIGVSTIEISTPAESYTDELLNLTQDTHQHHHHH